MVILAYIALVTLGVLLLLFASSFAKKQRNSCLAERDAIPQEIWTQLNPSVSSKQLLDALEVVARGLGIDSSYIQPTDRFNVELKVKGIFTIDEDAAEDAADAVIEELDIKWDASWETVQDAVSAISLHLARCPVPRLRGHV